jgi:hypothetical protein
MARGSRRAVAEIGRPFARYAPADLSGLRDAFVGGVPDGGRMFSRKVERCDAAALDITLQRCPLKEAWQQAGVSDTDVATLCRYRGPGRQRHRSRRRLRLLRRHVAAGPRRLLSPAHPAGPTR